jgi:hypothetical protein
MRSSLVLLAALGTTILSGCIAEDGRLGAEGSPIWFGRTSAAEQIAYFGKVCASYGFAYKTPAMAQCIATERRSSKQSADANMDSAMQNLQRQQQILEASRPRTTNCNAWGNQLNCTTY